MNAYKTEYAEAERVLESCPHPHDAYNDWCCECWNAYVYRRRDIRKREIAAYKETLPKCQRCGKSAGNWNVSGYHLCGKCKNLTIREHYQHSASLGSMAILAMGQPMFSTEGWVGRKEAGR